MYLYFTFYFFVKNFKPAFDSGIMCYINQLSYNYYCYYISTERINFFFCPTILASSLVDEKKTPKNNFVSFISLMGKSKQQFI